MLFKSNHLEGIRSGTITVAFRRWKKASVKKGSLIKTAIGLVKIQDITRIEESDLKKTDAVKAGFNDLDELMKTLNNFPGDLYKIKLDYHSEDPRIALRSQTSLDNEDFLILKEKLDRLDRYSKQGAWTDQILTAIQDHPRLRAEDLAKNTGREKLWLKLNIRKLKELGLTISHHPGYELSPLGKVWMKKSKAADRSE
jgi:hypothetical protein